MKEDEDCVVRAVDLTRKLCLVSKSMEKYVESELVPMNGLKGDDLSNIKIRKTEEELRQTTAYAPEMGKISRCYEPDSSSDFYASERIQLVPLRSRTCST